MKNKIRKIVTAWLLVISMIAPMLPDVMTVSAANAASDYNYDAMTMNEIFQLDRSLTWVFAGDSITHNDVWTGGMNSYSEWFEQYLYDIGRNDDSVILSAWSGASITDFQSGSNTAIGKGLENMITKYNPDVVFIKLGMNDRPMSTKEFKAYYHKMLDDLYASCSKIPKLVVMTPSPVSSENIYDDMHFNIIDLETVTGIMDSTLRIRNAVEDIVNTHNKEKSHHITFCDLRSAFLEEALVLGDDYHRTFFGDPSDGKLHPNAAGQYLIFKTLCKAIGVDTTKLPIFQVSYEDINGGALYVDSTNEVDYTNDYAQAGTTPWSSALKENYVWAVAGAEQMSGYEGPVVNRSLFRLIDNTMRQVPTKREYHTDIRMINTSASGLTVKDMMEKQDMVIKNHNPDVYMLLPEVSAIYDAEKYSAGSHEADVTAYADNIESIISKNKENSIITILWTPLASDNEIANGYLADYAQAVRNIVKENSDVLFFDAYRFMNENMTNEVLKRNWFGEASYISPLCAADLTRAFYTSMNETTVSVEELISHNLRLSTDESVFKSNYVNDSIAFAATADKETKNIAIDLANIYAVYPELTDIKIAWAKEVGIGNANVKELKTSQVGTTYTVAAPCDNPVLIVYGTCNGMIYRFRDLRMTITGVTTKEEVNAPTSAELTSLEVIGAPAITLEPGKTSYDVALYQYQKYIQVLATAQDGMTITVDGETVVSGENSQLIDVSREELSKITVEVSGTVGGSAVAKTYTLNLTREAYPDIIITEVMQDGYSNYTTSGNDNYELIEIYNASGRTLNLLDYSIGYKQDKPESGQEANKGQWPYYFTGNNQGFSGTQSTYTGINRITKYSTYDEMGNKEQAKHIDFPANSTMVVWVKFAPKNRTDEQKKTYMDSLTYQTLTQALKDHLGNQTLAVPNESQLVIAEVPQGVATAAVSENNAGTVNGKYRSSTIAKEVTDHFYMDNHYITTRDWLFVLKSDATQAENGSITNEGNNIISASKFVRIGGTDKLSTVFSYNTERGMSLVKNEAAWDSSSIGTPHTSEEQGYSNATTFGAIEYWQKPANVKDSKEPTVVSAIEFGEKKEATVNFTVSDDTDIRYVEFYAKKAGDAAWTKVIKKDIVFEECIANNGVANDKMSYTFQWELNLAENSADTIQYWGKVVDGTGKEIIIGSEGAPIDLCKYELVKYTAKDAITYLEGDKATCPKDLKGYLFAGWYKNENYEDIHNAIVSGADISDESVYALYVPEHVLGVMAQISKNLTDTDLSDDDTGAIRFVTSVDSLNYKEAGFFFTFGENAAEIKRSNSTVYKQLFGIYKDKVDKTDVLKDYEPSTSFCICSNYFKTHTFVNIPKSQFDLKITVIPFWETLDGTIVRGNPVTKCINDGRNTGLYTVKNYEEFVATLSYIEELDISEATITIAGDIEIPETVTISSGRNIVIVDDGTVRTIRRAFASGSVFKMGNDVSLTLMSTGTAAKPKLIFDGDKENVSVTGTSPVILADANSNCNVNIQKGVQFKNHKVNGTGAVIRFNANAGTLNIDGAQFENNECLNANGGALHILNGNEVTITDSVFSGNKAGYASAISSNGNSKLTIHGCTFSKNETGNSKSSWNDAAIYLLNNNGQVVIDNSTFAENVGNKHTGAIIVNGSTVSVSNSLFKGNTGKNGGAILNGGTLTLDGCTFDGNIATGEGGAIANEKTLTVKNSTFTNNTAVYGNDICGRSGKTASDIAVSGKVAADIYNRAATKLKVNETLTDGSVITVDWESALPSDSVGIIFKDKEVMNAGRNYIRLGETQFRAGYGLSYHKDDARAYLETVTTVTNYEELKNVVETVIPGQAVKVGVVRLAESFDFTGTITIPEGCDVTMEDDGSGTAKILTKTKAANMFVMSKDAALTFRSSGSAEEPKLILDGNHISHTGYATMISANNITQCDINILKGVAFKNNMQLGNGSVIRIANSDSSKLYIDGACFENNTATGRAGGVMTLNKVSAEIKNSVFTGNTADYGGAIETNGKLNVMNCRFEKNQSVREKETGGGAIYAWSSSAVMITDSEFIGNSAAYDGGAIYNNGGTLTLTGMGEKARFQGNTASNWGGAIYTTGGTLTTDGYAFDGNSAKAGGAILMFTESEISNTTFKENHTNVTGGFEGGAVYVNQSSRFTDCTFDGNRAKTNGGAILMNANGKTITLTGSDKTKAMFTGNQANDGAGLGGAIRLYAGTLAGSGYEFTDNLPDDISRREAAGATNNYKK